jgi:hypothetical protein
MQTLIPSCETLAARAVLAHRRTTFLSRTCGLRGGTAATITLTGCVGVDGRDELLLLHRRAPTLDRCSNSSFVMLRI